MELEVLRELQGRGRFFWEMFPGAKAANDWQRQSRQLERDEKSAGARRPVVGGSEEKEPGGLTFRLQANMRRGTGSSLHGTWSSYASVEDARLVAREMLRDDRVTHVTVVTATVPPPFVEWVNR